jgi:hypothetical protein
MNRFRLFVVNALFACGGLAVASGNTSNDIEVVGLQVRKKILNGKDLSDPETTVEVIIRQPGKRIIGLSSIKVTSFTDDKKTDLAENQDFSKGLQLLNRFADGSQVMFSVRTSKLPARAAKKLRVKGSVALRIGSGEMSLEKKNVKLESGATVKVGPFELGSYEQNLDASATGVRVAYSEDILKSIQFFDMDGQVISCRKMGGGSFGNVDVYYWDDYALTRKVERMTVRIGYYSKSETITVPLDLEVGLGF